MRINGVSSRKNSRSIGGGCGCGKRRNARSNRKEKIEIEEDRRKREKKKREEEINDKKGGWAGAVDAEEQKVEKHRIIE